MQLVAIPPYKATAFENNMLELIPPPEAKRTLRYPWVRVNPLITALLASKTHRITPAPSMIVTEGPLTLCSVMPLVIATRFVTIPVALKPA